MRMVVDVVNHFMHTIQRDKRIRVAINIERERERKKESA